MKCLSFGFKANSYLWQELVDNSCGIITVDCAVTISVTLENRLESESFFLTLKFMKTAALAHTQEFSVVEFWFSFFYFHFLFFFYLFICFFLFLT